jgi:hypothetical protein
VHAWSDNKSAGKDADANRKDAQRSRRVHGCIPHSTECRLRPGTHREHVGTGRRDGQLKASKDARPESVGVRRGMRCGLVNQNLFHETLTLAKHVSSVRQHGPPAPGRRLSARHSGLRRVRRSMLQPDPLDHPVLEWARGRSAAWYYTSEEGLSHPVLKVQCGYVTAYFLHGRLHRLCAHADRPEMDAMFAELTQVFQLSLSSPPDRIACYAPVTVFRTSELLS